MQGSVQMFYSLVSDHNPLKEGLKRSPSCYNSASNDFTVIISQSTVPINFPTIFIEGLEKTSTCQQSVATLKQMHGCCAIVKSAYGRAAGKRVVIFIEKIGCTQLYIQQVFRSSVLNLGING